MDPSKTKDFLRKELQKFMIKKENEKATDQPSQFLPDN